MDTFAARQPTSRTTRAAVTDAAQTERLVAAMPKVVAIACWGNGIADRLFQFCTGCKPAVEVRACAPPVAATKAADTSRHDRTATLAGYSCCTQQNTFCVHKAAGSSMPARCCPRWTVGCSSGSVGCCDPAQPWQWSISVSEPSEATSQPEPRAAGAVSGAVSGAVAGAVAGAVSGAVVSGTAYALVVSGWAAKGSSLYALSIDMASGRILKKVVVNSFRDDPAGESTREFLWDSQRQKFYYLDVSTSVRLLAAISNPTLQTEPYAAVRRPESSVPPCTGEFYQGWRPTPHRWPRSICIYRGPS